MIATTKIHLSDLSQQKRFETDLTDELTPEHTVGQAVEHYLDHMAIPENGLPWIAFSRGLRLDRKSKLSEVSPEHARWTVIPEISAGSR